MLVLIIAARNEEHSLPRTLRTLAEQKYQHFSLILVDNGSTDGTRKCMDAFQEGHHGIDVHIVAEPRAGRINALRAGVAYAHTISDPKIVAFSDADALFNPFWSFDVIRSYEQHPEAGFGYANEQFNTHELKDIPHFAYCIQQFAEMRHHIRSYIGGIMILNNCWVRLDLLDENSFEDAWATKSEDTLLTLKLLSMGYTGTYFDSAVVVSPRRLITQTASLYKWCHDGNMKSYIHIGGKKILCPVNREGGLEDVPVSHIAKTAQVKARRIMKRLLIQSCFETHPDNPLTHRLEDFMKMGGHQGIMTGWKDDRCRYEKVMASYHTTADRYEALQDMLITEQQARIKKGGDVICRLLSSSVQALHI